MHALAAVMRSLVLAAALLVAYWMAPLQGHASRLRLLGLLIGLAVVGVIMIFGVRSIVGSETPRLRAIQVLITVVPLFLICFAATYLAMSHQNSASFSTALSRTGALYLTVTIFSTVGFGDIVPVSDAARIVVMVQMIGDLVLIGAGVRVLISAVQVGLERKNDTGQGAE
jgi:hypothetical protein